MNTKSLSRRAVPVAAALLIGLTFAAPRASAELVPTVSVGNGKVCEGASGVRVIRFPVKLSAPSAATVTVGFITANGTAQAPADYTAKTGTVTFPPGYRSTSVAVSVIGETLDENREMFSLILTNPQGATIADGQGDGSILDDDPFPVVSIGDSQLAEPDTGNAPMTFRAVLDCNTTQAVTVQWTTAGGTATPGADYVTSSGTATITAGATLSGPILVPVNGDTAAEPDERFQVRLSNPVNAFLGDGSGSGLIVNDD